MFRPKMVGSWLGHDWVIGYTRVPCGSGDPRFGSFKLGAVQQRKGAALMELEIESIVLI